MKYNTQLIQVLFVQLVLLKMERIERAKRQRLCQQLKTIDDLGLYYYTNDRNSCEVDFVVDTGKDVIPVEVKAEVNLKSKSLKMYRERFSPNMSIRTSLADYKKEDWLINLPLYAIEEITKV